MKPNQHGKHMTETVYYFEIADKTDKEIDDAIVYMSLLAKSVYMDYTPSYIRESEWGYLVITPDGMLTCAVRYYITMNKRYNFQEIYSTS